MTNSSKLQHMYVIKVMSTDTFKEMAFNGEGGNSNSVGGQTSNGRWHLSSYVIVVICNTHLWT